MSPIHHHGAANATAACTSIRRTRLYVESATPIATVAQRTTTTTPARRMVGTTRILARVDPD